MRSIFMQQYLFCTTSQFKENKAQYEAYLK